MMYSLVSIIVNRGKGTKVLNYALELGVIEASCLYGKGTIDNKMLQLFEMHDVEKEIIFLVISSDREDDVLYQLNKKFNFERKNHGIVFTTPLASVMKIKADSSLNWNEIQNKVYEYVALLVIVDKGKAENVVRISQDAGFYGGTIVKAHGAASKLNVVLDMLVEPEKETVLMLIKEKDADRLSGLLNEELHLTQPNMGIILKFGVSKTVGLYQNSRDEEGNI